MISGMTVRSKLVLLLTAAIGTSVLIGIAGTLGLRETTDSIVEVADVRMPSILGLEIMHEGQTAVRATSRWVIGWEHDNRAQAKIAEALRKRGEIWARIDKGWAIYEPLPQTVEEALLWKQFVREWGEWKADEQKISEVILALSRNPGEPKRHALFAELAKRQDASRSRYSAADETLGKLIDLNVEVGIAAAATGKAGADWARVAMLAVGAISLGMLILLGVFIIRSILRQLGGDPLYVSQVAGKIAAGDLNVQLETKPGDTGSMLQSIKDMAQQLRRREQEFRAMVERSPDVIIRYDTQCRRIYANPALYDLLGVHKDNVLGKRPEDFTPLVNARAYIEMVKQAVETGREVQCEPTFHDVKGSLRWGHTRFVPEFSADGGVVSVLAITRDITEFKRTMLELEGLRTQLRGLIESREAVREEERKHIAREVHDELGQILTGVQLHLSHLADQYAVEMPAVSAALQQPMVLVDQTVDAVRNIAQSLRPAALDMGIVTALEWQAENFGKLTGIRCRFYAEDREKWAEEKISITLFRIVQEALTNVARHAQATEVDITLGCDGAGCSLTVRDNGVGFEPGTKKTESFGLIGIRERVLMLGGYVSIVSGSGRGTEITVHIPAGGK